MPLCPYCRTVVSEDMRFCPECGHPIPAGEVVEGKSKKKLAGIIVACIVAVTVIAVIAARTPTYTLSVSISPPGAGSVSPSSGEYRSGAQLTLTADPASGYYFDRWSGSASGTTTDITITMDSDKSVTASFATTPQPKFTTPGTGAIIGQVMLPDTRPAHNTVVYVFKGEETSSYAACYVDVNGYYMFDELPPDSYSIYTASHATLWGFTSDPKAVVTVREGVATTAPTLTQAGNIVISFDNPRIATMPGESYTSKNIIDGHNPKFTWNSVQNAAYYVVTIWSAYTEEYPSSEDYDESQQVVSNMIVWPTSLSSLPYQEFVIDVEAYTARDILIASGRNWFAVDVPPEGWVYK